MLINEILEINKVIIDINQMKIVFKKEYMQIIASIWKYKALIGIVDARTLSIAFNQITSEYNVFLNEIRDFIYSEQLDFEKDDDLKSIRNISINYLNEIDALLKTIQ